MTLETRSYDHSVFLTPKTKSPQAMSKTSMLSPPPLRQLPVTNKYLRCDGNVTASCFETPGTASNDIHKRQKKGPAPFFPSLISLPWSGERESLNRTLSFIPVAEACPSNETGDIDRDHHSEQDSLHLKCSKRRLTDSEDRGCSSQHSRYSSDARQDEFESYTLTPPTSRSKTTRQLCADSITCPSLLSSDDEDESSVLLPPMPSIVTTQEKGTKLLPLGFRLQPRYRFIQGYDQTSRGIKPLSE